MATKTFQERLNDLKSHTKLLSDACDRFISGYNSDEVKNIGVRLRVIVGSGKGSGLLFELANETNDEFQRKGKGKGVKSAYGLTGQA